MTESTTDAGAIAATIARFETFRLPQALKLKAGVERGERLEEFEVHFLSDLLADAEGLRPLVTQHPELAGLYTRVVDLYNSIMKQALENAAAH